MFKWLKRITNAPPAHPRRNRKAKAGKILDGIMADLAAVRNAQAQTADISERVKYHSLCVKSNSAAIEELQKQVAAVNQTVLKLSATLANTLEASSTTSPTPQTTSATEDFTYLQEAALTILLKLMTKENARWISMKMLVQNIYPGQNYNKVRTTIFEYIRLFEELGLVSRSKRGTHTFVSLTAKGVEVAKKKITRKKEKLLELPAIET